MFKASALCFATNAQPRQQRPAQPSPKLRRQQRQPPRTLRACATESRRMPCAATRTSFRGVNAGTKAKLGCWFGKLVLCFATVARPPPPLPPPPPPPQPLPHQQLLRPARQTRPRQRPAPTTMRRTQMNVQCGQQKGFATPLALQNRKFGLNSSVHDRALFADSARNARPLQQQPKRPQPRLPPPPPLLSPPPPPCKRRQPQRQPRRRQEQPRLWHQSVQTAIKMKQHAGIFCGRPTVAPAAPWARLQKRAAPLCATSVQPPPLRPQHQSAATTIKNTKWNAQNGICKASAKDLERRARSWHYRAPEPAGGARAAPHAEQLRRRKQRMRQAREPLNSLQQARAPAVKRMWLLADPS